MAQPLDLNSVIALAKTTFASHPQKEQIVKRIRRRLCQENYSEEHPHVNLHWGDTLWGWGDTVSEEEQDIIKASTHFIEGLPGVCVTCDKSL